MADRIKLNIADLLTEKGADEVLGSDEANPGIVNVRMGDQVKRVNTAKFLANLGINANEIDVEVGSASAPIDDNPMSFMEQAELATAATPNQQLQFMQKKYGKDKVAPTADEDGEITGFSVKQGNTWKKADIGFWADVVGGSGISMAGAIAGAAAGTAVAPGLGTIIGAGIGGALGKSGTIGIAHARGVRTEEDAADVAMEIGKEFIWSMAGEGATKLLAKAAKPALRYGERAIDAMAEGMKGFANLGQQFKAPVAQLISAMTGTKLATNITAQEIPEQVFSKSKVVKEWIRTGMQGAEPTLTKTTNDVSEALYQQSNKVQGIFKQIEQTVPELKHARVNVHDELMSFVDMVKELRIVDANLRVLPEAERGLAEFSLSKNTNMLKRALGVVKKVLPSEDDIARGVKADLSFEESAILQRAIGELSEASGTFGNGSAEISSRVAGILKNLGGSIKAKRVDEIRRFNPKAAEKWVSINDSFSKGRRILDEIGPMSRTNRMDELIKRLSDPARGNATKESLNELFRVTNTPIKPVLDDLMSTSAARDYSKLFTSEQSLFKNVMTPMIRAEGAVMPKARPLDAATWSNVGLFAKSVDFMQGLSQAQLTALRKNPRAMEGFLRSINQGLALNAMSRDNFNAQIQQAFNQGGQGGQ